MTWKPHLTVATIVQNKDTFLMVEECIDGVIRYNQPAGHLEQGETLIEAAIRETLEETAWHVEPEALIGIYRWNNPTNNRTFLRFSFSASCLQYDKKRTLDPDITQALWMTADDINNRSGALRSPLVLQSLNDYIKGERFPLSILKEMG